MAFLGKSWELAKGCFHVLMRDKEILLFPLIAGAIIFGALLVLIISFFIFPMLFIWFLVLTIFLGPLLFAFLGVLMEAAVVGCATIRLQGGDPKVGDGLKIAAKNWWPLLQWAFIGIIIGVILGFIRGIFHRPTTTRGGRFRPPGFPPIRLSPLSGNSDPRPYQSYESMGFSGSGLGIPGPSWGIGDILAGALGMAWAVATFFVIPIMIYEKLSPFKGIKRSVEIIKTVWKETLILKFGFGAIFALLGGIGALFILLGVIAGVTYLPEPVVWETGYTHIIITNAPALIAGIAAAVAYWVALGCVNFALKGILKATLYEYS